MGCGTSKTGAAEGNASVEPSAVPLEEGQRIEANFILFDDFKREGIIPRRGHTLHFKHPLTGQPNRNLCRPRSTFDYIVTLFIFISHRWLSPGGVDGHPDDKDGSKFKLIVEAVEKLLRSKPMKHDCQVALWIDFGCVDQDLENPAEELNELHEIIAQCDVLLTPVHDPEHEEWEYPAGGWKDPYEEYKAKAFQVYWSRAWCAAEAMSAACMPVVPSAFERGTVFREGGAIWTAVTQDRRPYIAYGTKESVVNRPPIFFPPLLHSNLAKYDPAKMELMSEKDRGTIKRIAEGLRKHIKPLEVGWKGLTNGKGDPHGWGRYVYADGCVYDGEYNNGKMHGGGTFKFADGTVYIGEYKDDEMHGRGTYKHASGGVYEGEYKDNNMHGRGTFKYASGAMYEGEYKDGKRNGRGKFKYSDGIVYNMHGRGTHLYTQGDVYEGEWNNNQKHGRGTFTYADGAVYTGEWKDDFKHGKGSYMFARGDAIYEGEYKDDKRNGRGTVKYADGRVYDGEWQDGKMDGRGTAKWADGSVYDGEWKDDKRHGKGTYKYAGGNVYEGEWKDDKRHGRGSLKSTDGDVYEGEWKDDKFLGPVTSC
jgi:hypothetical protein